MPAPKATIETEDDIAAALAELHWTDPRLVAVSTEAGPLPLRRTTPGFASLASIVVSQQVSRQSADAIMGRFVQLVDPLEPAVYLEAGEEVWRQVGLSRPKQRAIAAISEAVLAGAVDLDQLCTVDGDAAMSELTAIKGIGPWTAEIYLLFAAGHPDIFPAGDIALQAAVADAFAMPARPKEKELRRIAESWAPWRGVAARLFWAFYAARRGRTVAPQPDVTTN